MRALVCRGFLVAATLLSQDPIPPGVSITLSSSAGARTTARARAISEGSNRFYVSAGPLVNPIAYAFEVDPAHLDAPDWMRALRFDITARSDDGDVRAFLRRALIEKFSLVWHKETRLAEVWVMSLPGLPPGRLQPSEKTGPPWPELSFGEVVADLSCSPCQFERVAEVLGLTLDAPVIDETGLGGAFEFRVTWNRADPDSITRAWRDATGIELVLETRPAEFLVIDAAERPDAPAPPPPAWACEATPAMRAELDTLRGMDTGSRWALARKYPRDIFVQMRVQDTFRDQPSLEWQGALAFYRDLKDPVISPYLEARLVLGRERARSESLLADVIKRAPEFPWAHLTVVESTEAPDRRDVPRAERHMREFRRLCPASLAAFSHFRNIEDPAMLEDAAHALAALLDRRVDDEEFAAWPCYWDVLRRITPAEGREILRKQLRMDLIRLRLFHRPASPAWISALRYGYRLIGDEAGTAWLDRIVTSRSRM
jgi:uncharacterized protein (TIGR03435 family)